MIPKLPCGHEIDEEAKRRMKADNRNFYTCRNIPGQHEGCEPAQAYILEPQLWHTIVPRIEYLTPPPSEEEKSLREKLQNIVKERLKKRTKSNIKPKPSQSQ